MESKKIIFNILIVIFLSYMPMLRSETYTFSTLGNTDYIYGSNGYSSTGSMLGNSYYQYDNQGNSSVTYKIGDIVYCDIR